MAEYEETENTDDQKLLDLHSEALLQFDAIQSVVQEEREQSRDDRRFCSIAGAMWEGEWGQQFENKPKMEVNKIQLSLMRIYNEYRNNRITVDFVSKDGADNVNLADVCDGLYRADEEESGAEEAYDNAFDEATAGGYGAWRLRADWEDEFDDEDDRQRILLEPIFDADTSVFFDLDAKRQDKADANHCFVLNSVTRKAYEEEWDDNPTSWPSGLNDYQFDWTTPDIVYVAEYYKVEYKKETIKIFTLEDSPEKRYTAEELEADPEIELGLLTIGYKETGEKKVRRKKIHKYIMSGGGVLEDCGCIAGQHIPIVPMYGKRWYVDNIERSMGHVRLSKDPQRLKNMQLSKLAEISALSATRKPIFTPEQVQGVEQRWADDNIQNFPYQLVNPMTDIEGNPMPAGAIGYTEPPIIPPALGALLQLTEEDMKDILGERQGGEQIVSNVSGKAVELIQNRMDMQTFIYMSNMAKAMKRSGEIWLSMAKDVYVEDGRKMRTVGPQKEVSSVELNQPMMMEDTNEAVRENDLSKAKFNVSVDVGPSTSNKRESTVRSLTGMMQMTTDPEMAQVLGAMAMMNMEGEGIQDTRDFFRQKLIRMGAVKPTKEEAAQLQEEAANRPPDPQTVYFESLAKEAEANAVKSMATVEKTAADVANIKAKTVEILAGIDRDDQQAAINAAEKIGALVEGLNQTEVQEAQTDIAQEPIQSQF
jgi:hypothetical protein